MKAYVYFLYILFYTTVAYSLIDNNSYRLRNMTYGKEYAVHNLNNLWGMPLVSFAYEYNMLNLTLTGYADLLNLSCHITSNFVL